ncbi:MAG: efflux RND transporter permease subunit [Verrucomicrobiota bacterium]
MGLQGGLTGSLFREFALTLAGAVTISGIVALTLSPMMAANLLRGGDHAERGFPGFVNRQFDSVRKAYGRVLDGTLRHRPAVYIVWVVITALTPFMFMFSPAELATAEDQGVIFGILTGSANATTDQKMIYSKAVESAFLSTKEAEFSFLLTFGGAAGAVGGADGFGGMVLKPGAKRERTVFQVMPEVQQKLGAIPGMQVFATTPSALPGGSNFPVEFVIASTADADRLLEALREAHRLPVPADRTRERAEIRHDHRDTDGPGERLGDQLRDVPKDEVHLELAA